MTWNLGSVGSVAINFFDNVPTHISGVLPVMADMSRVKVQNYTGVTIGSNSITEAYQPAILYFTLAQAAQMLAVEGSDKGYSIGDLSIEAGGTSSAPEAVANRYEKMAEQELKALGKKASYYRTY